MKSRLFETFQQKSHIQNSHGSLGSNMVDLQCKDSE